MEERTTWNFKATASYAAAYLDFFNITNSHASETITRAAGLSYLKPSAILAPFTTRVGFRFLF